MSELLPDGPWSGRKESSVRIASRYALFLKDIAENPSGRGKLPSGRSTDRVLFSTDFKVS
jgi:hypothetical protein